MVMALSQDGETDMIVLMAGIGIGLGKTGEGSGIRDMMTGIIYRIGSIKVRFYLKMLRILPFWLFLDSFENN